MVRLVDSGNPGKPFLEFAQTIFAKPFAMTNDDFIWGPINYDLVDNPCSFFRLYGPTIESRSAAIWITEPVKCREQLLKYVVAIGLCVDDEVSQDQRPA